MATRARYLIVLTLLALWLTACGGSTPVSQSGAPTILIEEPANGQQVLQGQEVVIRFTATGSLGISRVEVGVDGTLLRTLMNPTPAPDSAFAGQHVWTADAPGSHSILAVAYDAGGAASSPAVVNISVVTGGSGSSPPESSGSEGSGVPPTPTWTPLAVAPEASPSESPPEPSPESTRESPPESTSEPTTTPEPTATQEPTPTATATTKPPAGSKRPNAPGPITDFETFGTWKRGDEPNGTFTQSSAQVHGGSYAGKLAYNFPGNNNDYVVFLQTHKLGGEPNQVSAWVYGDGSKHYLNVWISDAKGEMWQFPLGQVTHSGWQQMTAWLDPAAPWPAGHISGPSNNAIDYPIDFRGLVLDDIPDPFTGGGTIYVDDLRCDAAGQPPPTATTQAGAASIRFWADDDSITQGSCTRLRWEVENVREVYLDGQGKEGHGSQKVCPAATTSYELRVVHKDGSVTRKTLTIQVTAP